MNTDCIEWGAFRMRLIELTPPLAESFLGKRDTNPRKPIPTVLSRYVRDVASDNWHLGAGFLAFDEKDSLVQGQHTCLAVVAAGKSIVIPVFYGLTPEAVRVLDTGKPRQFGQILAAESIANASAVAAAVRTLWRWEYGQLTNTNVTPTIDESYMYLALNPGVIDSVKACNALSAAPIKFRLSVSGAVHYAAATLCPDDVDAFFSRLLTGANLTEGDPILALRNLLISAASTQRVKFESTHLHAVAIKAWNGYIEGREVKQLKWLRGGNKNEPFPTMVGRDGETFPAVSA